MKTLVQELSHIVLSKEQYLKSKFETSATLNSRYSNVADLTTFNEYQLADYQKNPDEYELLFRMEKISGALRFVTSLEKFSTIFKFIRRAIVKIEDLNAEIYPELSASIIPLREEVTNLKNEVQKLSAEYELLEKKAERHYRKIEIIQDRYKKSEDKDKAEKKYYNRHPELAELEESMNKLNAELLPQRRHLSMREKFLDSLEGCKSKIESYGILELDF